MGAIAIKGVIVRLVGESVRVEIGGMIAAEMFAIGEVIIIRLEGMVRRADRRIG
ncbi:MAG: hypothetical protein J6386_03040 [Candidatus Synoicihabitans palmerolidicus]|nr:hypothetical protein [Candidatus Synoicihabitans palmerolidicus]